MIIKLWWNLSTTLILPWLHKFCHLSTFVLFHLFLYSVLTCPFFFIFLRFLINVSGELELEPLQWASRVKPVELSSGFTCLFHLQYFSDLLGNLLCMYIKTLVPRCGGSKKTCMIMVHKLNNRAKFFVNSYLYWKNCQNVSVTRFSSFIVFIKR